MKSQDKIIELCETSLFIALVFIATFALKIPGPFGYLHLGDCMIFLAVLMLGSKRAAVAGGTGAALADLVGGYAVWVLPTLICKVLMVVVMGVCLEGLEGKLRGRARWLVGAVTGGVVQCVGYTVARAFLYGLPAALVSIPGLLVQTGSGVLLALAVSEGLRKTVLGKRFTEGV